VTSVQVVVVSYNSAAHLRACVEPLTRATSIEVTVVDSASSDCTLGTIADLAVEAVPLTQNRGFAHACNVGWRRGRAPFVLFLNPDATIDTGAIDRLARAAQDATVGVVAPKIVEPDGSLDFSMRRFPRLRSTYAQALFLHRLFPKAAWSDELVRDEVAYSHPAKPEWVSGACMLVKREALERVGGLDEGFFLYCEDLDLCRRIRDAGFEIAFEPTAIAVHEGGASAPRASLLPILAASRTRYAHKHQPRAAARLEQVGVALAALTHSVISRGGSSTRRGHLLAAHAAARGVDWSNIVKKHGSAT
jgi:N-acetylglucosaminyl-diphospho-decaprenol L-rhamnosyltransferase